MHVDISHRMERALVSRVRPGPRPQSPLGRHQLISQAFGAVEKQPDVGMRFGDERPVSSGVAEVVTVVEEGAKTVHRRPTCSQAPK